MEMSLLRERISYQGVLLAGFSLLTTAILVLANRYTAPAISAAEQHDLELSLGQVLPTGISDNNILKDVVTLKSAAGTPVAVHRARKGGEVRAAVFETASPGYAGPIVLLVGVSRDGVLHGVRVLRHTETPGLGDKIEEAKSNWIHAFDGKSLSNAKWGVKKDSGEFDQFAGATITPRAVVKAVKEALDFHKANHAAIYEEK